MSNNKYKILIVEDEANIRSFIKANLETSDYQVICAETCTLGIMLYASHHPDLGCVRTIDNKRESGIMESCR